MRRTRTVTAPAILIVFLTISACSPSVSPLFRDYEYRDRTVRPEDTQGIEAAFQNAGWKTKDADAPNVVATDFRTIAHWGLYKVVVQLEAVPFGDGYVRVFIHPYRQYITGGRSKIPYLSHNIRQKIVPDLSKAFEQNGLALVGTPQERDKIAEDPGY